MFGSGSAFAWSLECFPLLLSLEFLPRVARNLKLLDWVSVLPQKPLITSSSCSRIVTSVFAGELVELESWLVYLKEKRRWRSVRGLLGKVLVERYHGRDLRSEIVPQRAWTGQDVLRGWRPGPALVFADACTTHRWKSGCDSSEIGFPKRKWRPWPRLSFLFWVQNPSPAVVVIII